MTPDGLDEQLVTNSSEAMIEMSFFMILFHARLKNNFCS
jgi:hypothetical protein